MNKLVYTLSGLYKCICYTILRTKYTVRIVHHSTMSISERQAGRGIPPCPERAWRNGFGELELILISQNHTLNILIWYN